MQLVRFAGLLGAVVVAVACGRGADGSSTPREASADAHVVSGDGSSASSIDGWLRPAAAPTPEKRPVEIVQHGETRVDEYAWMRATNWRDVLRDPTLLDADIRRHLDAELTYFDESTAGLDALRQQLIREMESRVSDDFIMYPLTKGPWEYFEEFEEGADYPVFLRRPIGGGASQVVFDGNVEAAGADYFEIGPPNTSPDHRLVAIPVDREGNEYYTIRVRNIETGEAVGDEIRDASGSGVVWAADSRSFFYIARDEAQRPKRVMHHVLGRPIADDRLVYEEPDDGFGLGMNVSRSGEYLIVTSGNLTESEVRVVPTANPDAAPTVIAERTPGLLYYVHHQGDHFYIRTNADGAVDFKVVRAPVSSPGRENWSDWVAYRPGRMIVHLYAYADFIVREERENGLPQIVVSRGRDKDEAIAFEDETYDAGVLFDHEYATDLVRLSYSSPTRPAQVLGHHVSDGRREVIAAETIPGHDPNLYVAERFMAPARDGEEIPVSILRLKSTPTDGSAPMLLNGFGAYGRFSADGFSSNVLSLVDRGMVFAVAHVRGGTAKGRQWYLDGKLGKKQNTFNDFIDSAEALIAAGYTSPKKIVIYGGSGGGLLIGASLNQRPDLFAGAVARVPFVDVLNTMSDATIPLTPREWPEWGDPASDATAYGWIRAYSPYENIKPDTSYPPVLAVGAVADFRVPYWEPAKWISRLRDQADGGPFFLLTDMGSGHSGPTGRFGSLGMRAEYYAFILAVAGLADAEPLERDP